MQTLYQIATAISSINQLAFSLVYLEQSRNLDVPGLLIAAGAGQSHHVPPAPVLFCIGTLIIGVILVMAAVVRAGQVDESQGYK